MGSQQKKHRGTHMGAEERLRGVPPGYALYPYAVLYYAQVRGVWVDVCVCSQAAAAEGAAAAVVEHVLFTIVEKKRKAPSSWQESVRARPVPLILGCSAARAASLVFSCDRLLASLHARVSQPPLSLTRACVRVRASG